MTISATTTFSPLELDRRSDRHHIDGRSAFDLSAGDGSEWQDQRTRDGILEGVRISERQHEGVRDLIRSTGGEHILNH